MAGDGVEEGFVPGALRLFGLNGGMTRSASYFGRGLGATAATGAGDIAAGAAGGAAKGRGGSGGGDEFGSSGDGGYRAAACACDAYFAVASLHAS